MIYIVRDKNFSEDFFNDIRDMFTRLRRDRGYKGKYRINGIVCDDIHYTITYDKHPDSFNTLGEKDSLYTLMKNTDYWTMIDSYIKGYIRCMERESKGI